MYIRSILPLLSICFYNTFPQCELHKKLNIKTDTYNVKYLHLLSQKCNIEQTKKNQNKWRQYDFDDCRLENILTLNNLTGGLESFIISYLFSYFQCVQLNCFLSWRYDLLQPQCLVRVCVWSLDWDFLVMTHRSTLSLR